MNALVLPATAGAEPPPSATPAPPPPVAVDTTRVQQWSEFFQDRAEASQAAATADLDARFESASETFTLRWNQAVSAADAVDLRLPDLDTSLDLPAPSLDGSLGVYQTPDMAQLEALFGPARPLPAPGQVGDHPALDRAGFLNSAYTGCRLTDPACRAQIADQQLNDLAATAASGNPAMALFAQAADLRHGAEAAETDRAGVDFPYAGDLTDQLITGGHDTIDQSGLCPTVTNQIMREEDIEQLTDDELESIYDQFQDTDTADEFDDVDEMRDWLLDRAASSDGIGVPRPGGPTQQCPSVDRAIDVARNDQISSPDVNSSSSDAARYLAVGILTDPELAARDPRYDLAVTLNEVLIGAAPPSALERFGDVAPADINAVAPIVANLYVLKSSECTDWHDVEAVGEAAGTRLIGPCDGDDVDTVEPIGAIETAARRWAGDPSVPPTVQHIFDDLAELSSDAPLDNTEPTEP